MGPGKAALLDAIGATGSIAGAARSLGMSYRRAWLLVETCNRCFSDPLVATHPGNGARLTAAGSAIVAAYRRLESGINAAALGADYAAIAAALAAPRAPDAP